MSLRTSGRKNTFTAGGYVWSNGLSALADFCLRGAAKYGWNMSATMNGELFCAVERYRSEHETAVRPRSALCDFVVKKPW